MNAPLRTPARQFTVQDLHSTTHGQVEAMSPDDRKAYYRALMAHWEGNDAMQRADECSRDAEEARDAQLDIEVNTAQW